MNESRNTQEWVEGGRRAALGGGPRGGGPEQEAGEGGPHPGARQVRAAASKSASLAAFRFLVLVPRGASSCCVVLFSNNILCNVLSHAPLVLGSACARRRGLSVRCEQIDGVSGARKNLHVYAAVSRFLPLFSSAIHALNLCVDFQLFDPTIPREFSSWCSSAPIPC